MNDAPGKRKTRRALAIDIGIFVLAGSAAAALVHYDAVRGSRVPNFFDLVSKTSLAFVGFIVTSVSIMVVLVSKEEMKRVRESRGANEELWTYARRAITYLAMTAGLSAAPAILAFDKKVTIPIFCASFALAAVSIYAVHRVISSMFAIIESLRDVWTNRDRN